MTALCDYEDTCARYSFSDCMYCDENYKNKQSEQEKVLKRLEQYIEEFSSDYEGDNGYSYTVVSVDHLKKWFIEELRSEINHG